MRIEGKLDVLPLIRKFSKGITALSPGQWVSSGFHISLAGLLGAGGLILATRDYKFRKFGFLSWSEDRDGSLEKWVVPGLQNLGNNCFLNVILQALASCSCLQTFLEKTVEECESLLGEEWVDSLPLTAALASLMEGLCSVHRGRTILSPRRLMNVMDRYISNFNLASQQDAEEAFFHILSSLRDEVSSRSVLVCSSLADATAINNWRILSSTRSLEQTEQETWEKHFLGPFNGIVCSSLTCESCSFQISLDFQFFHSLYLSPVLCSGANNIMPGCSLEDCLRQFFVAEELENYCCSNCWHIAAEKYLSLMDENETDIERLGHCCEQDSCECKHLPGLKAMPWANSFSRTFKQLSIARSPKILCIHLKRVALNAFGELVKLQGHISFPFILNLHPFVKNGVGAKDSEETLQRVQAIQQLQHQPHINHFHSQLRKSMLDGIYGQYKQGFREGPKLLHTGGCSDNEFGGLSMQSDNKIAEICHSTPSESHLYQLVSVVQHFGRAGSGHYTVYRRVQVKNDGDIVGLVGSKFVSWFCISDTEVYCVSERDVLAAEASLLFYEKVSDCAEVC